MQTTADMHPLIQNLARVTAAERAAQRTGPTLWNAQEAVQVEANRIAVTDPEGARKLLLAAANTTHAPYPQFERYWDDWMLAALTRNLRMKGGSVPAGDVVLANPRLSTGNRVFYSARRNSNISTEPRRVRMPW